MGANTFRTVEFTVPAGTPKNAPASQLLFDTRATIVSLSVKVPPGPAGRLGFRFDHSNEQVIPKVAGTWIVADDEVVPIDLDDMSPWPDWRIKGYNLGSYDHTLFVRLRLDDRVPVDTSVPPLIPIE